MSSQHKDTHSTPAKAQPAQAAHSVPTAPTGTRMNARVDQPSNRPVGVPSPVTPAPMPASRKPDTTAPQPQAPAITSVATATVVRGESFKYQVEGTNSPSTFAADGLPPGLTIDPKGVISGKPDSRGDYAVKISASNAVGVGHMTLTLTVS